jgi:hypothetical protein
LGDGEEAGGGQVKEFRESRRGVYYVSQIVGYAMRNGDAGEEYLGADGRITIKPLTFLPKF